MHDRAKEVIEGFQVGNDGHAGVVVGFDEFGDGVGDDVGRRLGFLLRGGTGGGASGGVVCSARWGHDGWDEGSAEVG